MHSIRRRALVGGVITAIGSVLIVSLLLFAYIDRITLDRFDHTLADRQLQVAIALSNNSDNPDTLESVLTDPAYGRPYSGRYWQINGPKGAVFTSPSLFGAVLDPPSAATADASSWTAPGLNGGKMRGMEQRITLGDGSKWTVLVAENLRDLQIERLETRRSLLLAFGFLAVLGLAGAVVQTFTMLRPISRLRHDVAKRWDKGEGPDPAEYPVEVAPLVADINTLIARNREIVTRARRQSADLAHALKTPTAILRNELAALAAEGHDTSRAAEALARVDAQLGRSLARMRAANSVAAVGAPSDLSASVARFGRHFAAMADRDGKHLHVAAAEGLTTRMDSQDIEEILGNLLDNALKWCRHAIRLSASAGPDGAVIRVEDDGPGIPEDARAEVRDSGRRLDTSKPGTGLGLAIVSDLAQAYGATLDLAASDALGGLSVTVTIPAQHGLAAA